MKRYFKRKISLSQSSSECQDGASGGGSNPNPQTYFDETEINFENLSTDPTKRKRIYDIILISEIKLEGYIYKKILVNLEIILFYKNQLEKNYVDLIQIDWISIQIDWNIVLKKI